MVPLLWVQSPPEGEFRVSVCLSLLPELERQIKACQELKSEETAR